MAPVVQRFKTAHEATAATEFALIAPLFVLLFAGIVEFGEIFQVYSAVNRLTSQYALAWSDCVDSPAGTCNTELASYAATATISNILPQLKTSNLSVAMYQISMSGSTPSVTYSYPSNSTLTSAQTTLAQSTFSSGQSGIIITVSYTHTLSFFNSLISPALGNYLTPSYTIVALKA